MPNTAKTKSVTSTQYPVITASNPAEGFGAYGTARAVSIEVCFVCTKRSTTNVSSAGASRKIATTAPFWKSCWPITSLKTSVASTLKLPPITLGMPKSVMTSVKLTIAALAMPYFAPGSVIVKNLRSRLVPSASAAS